MKRIIFLLLILIPFLASAQKTTPGNYTYIAQKYEWDAGIFKGLGLPSGAGPAAFITGQVGRAGAVYYDSVGADAGMYIYDGTAWVLQGSPSAVSLPDEILSPGYVTYSGTGLTFYISPSVYRIDGIIYGTDQDSVTLTTADPDDPRKDVIYLDTAGVQLLTGTPAEVATEPQLDAGQLKLTVADLAAGATVPTLTAQIVYDEGTESTVTNTGTTTNPNNTTNVFRLTKSLDVTDISNGDIIYYQIAGIPLAWDVTNISGLSMFIKLKAVMPSTGHLFVRLDVDATAVSTEAEIIINRNSLEWQAVTVPRSALGNLTSNSVTRVMMRYKRSVATVFSGFYLDYMHFQQGLTQPGTPGGVSTVTAAIPGWNTTGPTAGDVNLTLTPPGTRAQIMRGNATAETDSTVKYVGTVNSQTKSANGAVINTATNELILQEADPDDNGIVSAYDWRRLDTTANQTVHNLPSDGSSDSIMVNLDAFSTAFKRFKAGTNVTLTVNDSTIIVNSSGGGGSQTLQQVMTTGSILTTNNSVNIGANTLTFFGQSANHFYSISSSPTASENISLSRSVADFGISSNIKIADSLQIKVQNTSGPESSLTTYGDSIVLRQSAGKLLIKSLTSAAGEKALRYNPATGLVTYADTTIGGGGGSGAWGAITGTLSDQTDLQTALDLKATLASPAFTGVPIAPTATPATNNTQIATTAYVDAATAALGDITVGSITGAISLDSGDLGTLWQLSGTTTDYTVDLPTAVGNESKSIIFKGLSILTKNVTIAGISGQTIDGNSTYIMGGGGSLTLLSDGTNWTIVNQVGSWINYTPVWSGFSSDPPIARAVYFLSGKMCTVALICSGNGTSNATTLTVTVPFPAKQSALLWAFGFNNSSALTTVARLDLATGSSTAAAQTTPNGAAWTASGGKRLNFTITYEIE